MLLICSCICITYGRFDSESYDFAFRRMDCWHQNRFEQNDILNRVILTLSKSDNNLPRLDFNRCFKLKISQGYERKGRGTDALKMDCGVWVLICSEDVKTFRSFHIKNSVSMEGLGTKSTSRGLMQCKKQRRDKEGKYNISSDIPVYWWCYCAKQKLKRR